MFFFFKLVVTDEELEESKKFEFNIVETTTSTINGDNKLQDEPRHPPASPIPQLEQNLDDEIQKNEDLAEMATNADLNDNEEECKDALVDLNEFVVNKEIKNFTRLSHEETKYFSFNSINI